MQIINLRKLGLSNEVLDKVKCINYEFGLNGVYTVGLLVLKPG